MTANPLTADVAEQLRAVLGDAHLLTDPELRAGYERDITGRFGAAAAAVARPGDTGEVARVLRICSQRGVAVVPQGGNTGLVGGGVPRGGELLLSLARLQRLDLVDRDAGQVIAGAGVTLEQLQHHARAAGCDVGIDHGARSAATIGGMTATNAGGGLAMRHGTMRAQVAGVEAVLPDGTVVSRLAGLLKDNAGYDLSSLLVGSEGTLAVITAVNVRLIAARNRRVTALFGLSDLRAALELVTHLRGRVESLVAADFFDSAGLGLVLGHRRMRAPFERTWPVYVVAECAADRDPTEQLADAVEEADVAGDVAVADDGAGRSALWAYRELQNESLAAAGVPHKLDVSVRLADVPRFADEVRATVARVDPDAVVVLYGHLGDGNVHVNVLGPGPDDERVDDAVLELVGDRGGSISAEHGVGVAKRGHIGLCRGAGELALMRAVKRAFDPVGILNPGCTLPDAGQSRSAEWDPEMGHFAENTPKSEIIGSNLLDSA